MATDYRLDPFKDVLNSVKISGETHTIPSVSPYSIRLVEVPLKETPSSINLAIAGVAAEEVSSAPAARQFWPDYSTGADGDDSWNTGTILFNAADAGKEVVVAYKGTGTLVWANEICQMFVLTESGKITAPPWATRAILSGCGGGGGGGNSTWPTYPGGGGGSSAWVDTSIVKVTGRASYTVFIGAGGTGGISSTPGTAGGTTSFGSLLSIGGGGGSYRFNGGSAGVLPPYSFGKAGTDGSKAIYDSDNLPGAAGADSLNGAGGAATDMGSKTVTNGNAATGYGAGGGGAKGGAAYRGGAGSQGFLIVRWVR